MDPKDKYFYVHSGYNQATSVGPCKGSSGSCFLDDQFSYPSPGTYMLTGNLQLSSPPITCSPTSVNVGGGQSAATTTNTIISTTTSTTFQTNSAPFLTISASKTVVKVGEPFTIYLTATTNDPKGINHICIYDEANECRGSGLKYCLGAKTCSTQLLRQIWAGPGIYVFKGTAAGQNGKPASNNYISVAVTVGECTALGGRCEIKYTGCKSNENDMGQRDCLTNWICCVKK